MKFIILLTLLWLSDAEDNFLVVTNSGPVRGTTVSGSTGKEVDVFYGIPYAEPPVGRLKFGPPVEIKPWTDEIDASVPTRPCYSRVIQEYQDLYPNETFINIPKNWTEDCLRIHMWIPKPRPTNSTVMAYIHGGGFFEGDPLSAEFSGATLASEENVIIASMNYRLDVQGFMSLGLPEAPGNVGLMDQQLALKWIHRNIANFGGNPDDITIFGLSAGSASVGFQILAPDSAGLFHRAIMMSASPTASYANRDKDEIINKTLEMAEYVGCSDENATKVLHCLQNVNPDRFIEPEFHWRKGAFSLDDLSPGGPTVDGRFITDSPINLLKKKQFHSVDVMTGVTAQEGFAFLSLSLPALQKSPDGRITKDQFEILLNSNFKRFSNDTKKALSAVYTGSAQVLTDDPDLLRDAIGEMTSDYFFNCPFEEFADNFGSGSGRNVYRYVVDHPMSFFPVPQWMGTVHGLDLALHMGIVAGGGPNITQEDVDLSKRVMKWWANFARTGNPNADGESLWPPSTVQEQEYLEIGLNPTVKKHFRAEKCAMFKAVLSPADNIISPS